MEPELPSSPRPRIYRCYCRRRRETNPLFRAVLADDLDELKNLIEEGDSVNTLNSKGSSLLNFVMRRKRVEIFDYLLTLDEIDVNFLDRFDQSPLLYLAGVCFDEYFARKLIEKGADIHATDDSGFTFLHLAAKSDCEETLSVGQLVIEMGADVNQPQNFGMTPLYLACEAGRFDWVCLLLYYGADVTIATKRSILPLAGISHEIPEEQQLQLQEILFNYTFDEEKIVMKLPTLVAAMTSNTDLFPKILENISDVDYDYFDLQYLATSLIHAKPRHLRLFIEKYGYIIKDLIDNYPPLDINIRVATELGAHGLTELIDFFLNSEYVADFVLSTSTSNTIIANLLDVYSSEDHPVDKEAFTKTVCVMLTYGLNVTTYDLDAVYLKFGYCELFEILLHMDITLIARCNCQDSMAVLYYNPFATVDQFFDEVSMHSVLLDYYNNRKLKEIVAKSNESETFEKVKKLPQVPLLLELSRDAARKYIVNYFKIKSCVQFYTVLHWLPIGEMNKSILALVKTLY